DDLDPPITQVAGVATDAEAQRLGAGSGAERDALDMARDVEDHRAHWRSALACRFAGLDRLDQILFLDRAEEALGDAAVRGDQVGRRQAARYVEIGWRRVDLDLRDRIFDRML